MRPFELVFENRKKVDIRLPKSFLGSDRGYSASTTTSIFNTRSQPACSKRYSASSLPVAGFLTVLPVATRLALARMTGFWLLRGLVRSARIAGGKTTANTSQSFPASTTSFQLDTVWSKVFTSTSP